ncbi:MAG: glycine oxidase, partial [Curvibacter sp.]
YGPRRLQSHGLYRHGFMISPALLDVVLELVQEQRTTLAGSLALQVEESAA